MGLKGSYKSYRGINYIRRDGIQLGLFSKHTSKQEAQARAKTARSFMGK